MSFPPVAVFNVLCLDIVSVFNSKAWVYKKYVLSRTRVNKTHHKWPEADIRERERKKECAGLPWSLVKVGLAVITTTGTTTSTSNFFARYSTLQRFSRLHKNET
jgi:hypothetical protein